MIHVGSLLNSSTTSVPSSAVPSSPMNLWLGNFDLSPSTINLSTALSVSVTRSVALDFRSTAINDQGFMLWYDMI